MTTATQRSTEITVLAARGATAWLNAFLASGNDEDTPVLCRTLSVEFFPAGVQFVGCDGTLLFRTWAPTLEQDMPLPEEAPDASVVVMDVDKFAKAFMTTLLSACGGDGGEHIALELCIEPDESEESALSEEFESSRLTLRALGQELHCKLYDGKYPNWRAAHFGVERIELVDGMKLATRMFATVGKLKGVTSVDCEFHGSERQIALHGRGLAEVRGLMMPMRRESKKTKMARDVDGQEEAL